MVDAPQTSKRRRGLLLRCTLTTALLCSGFPARASNARDACIWNLREIDLAIENYRSAYGGKLPADIVDKQGRPLLSWRVQLLPFLGEQDLFKQFHLDEPWDSPHNIRFLQRIPKRYMCWAQVNYERNAEGSSTYLAVRGNRDGLPGGVVRGRSNEPGMAVAILEADPGHAVPWTKPEDLEFNPDYPTHGLVRTHGGDDFLGDWGSLALFDDGSIRLLSPDMDTDLLRSVLDGSRRPIRWVLPWYEALLVPRLAFRTVPWLFFCSLTIGGSIPVVVRLFRGKNVAPGEILWLAVGCAFFTHLLAVLICYQYFVLRYAGEAFWNRQRLFWVCPAAISVLVFLLGIARPRFSKPWRILFVVATVLFALDALDAESPIKVRPLEDSFVTVFPPVFSSLIGMAACWLTVQFGAGASSNKGRLIHWAGIVAFLLPPAWFAVCYSLGLTRLYEMFVRISD